MSFIPKKGLFAGQTFSSERQYRNALAQRKGYSTWSAWRRAPKPVRGTRDLAALSPIERETRRAAFDALNRTREEGLSLTKAARRAGTTREAVVRHAGSALERSGSGYLARPSDRLFRLMTVLGEDGVEREVALRGSRTASAVGQHWSAVNHYLRTGDDSRLRKLRGKRVGGIALETDAPAIDQWERRGELEIEDIYELTT